VNGRAMKFRGIVMHSIGIYGCFYYFFRHLFCKCNGSFAGEGAHPTPICNDTN